MHHLDGPERQSPLIGKERRLSLALRDTAEVIDFPDLRFDWWRCVESDRAHKRYSFIVADNAIALEK
jgi:hypothetical protein